MTAGEAFSGWCMMTQAERNAFTTMLVREKVLTSVEAMRLATIPQRRLDS